MVMNRIVRIWVRVKVNVSVNRVRVMIRLMHRVSVRVSVIANRVKVKGRMGTENSASHVYLSVLDGK